MLEMNKKYKILIVDDSSFNRLVMTSMLAKDYLLEEASDGKQAVMILQERAEEFSLVLLDIVMPHMDGFEFLKVMKTCGWLDFLPVIMISSEYTPENIETSYRLGASDLIQRPYDERVVCHRIANTIALTSRQRELSNALVDEVIRENESSAAMVSILSHIVETRNGESGAHVQNIRTITGMLLEQLAKRTDRYPLSKEEQLLIVTASSLHDIGKMSVPEEILNKPGRLTDEEFRVMKGHSMAGADMVEPLLHKENANPLIKMTYEICRWHHERYDGRGYPDGLKGDDIPIAAQVVSVADVYDALTSVRCYKPAHPHEKAMEMILTGQCGTFNPLLLECLSELSDRLKSPAPGAEEGIGAASDPLLIADVLAHSRENGMFSSDKIMQTLNRERLRSKFFFNEPRAAFYYTAFPPVLYLNKTARELFGVEESSIGYERELSFYEGYDRSGVERLRGRLAAATNEHPVIKDELLLDLHGEGPRRFQCVMQTIWDSAGARQYAEVVGRLIPVDGEAGGAPASGEAEAFLPDGGVMTGRSAWYLMNALKFMVYNVRLVDPADGRVVELDSSGKLSKSGRFCYELWKQDRRCANCTSLRCLHSQRKSAKIVFSAGEVFYVVSQYLEIDGSPLVLEMLTRITDDVLIDGSGNMLSSRSISDLHNKLYRDTLTNVYNRRYYNARAQLGEKIAALAIIKVDGFKQINDRYGRTVGDDVLVAVARAAGGDIQAPDALVRYDGGEFVAMFASDAADAFEEKLHRISGDIAAISIDGMEGGPRVTASIGGAVGPDSPAALLKKADEMLHRALEKPGTGIVTFPAREK